MAPAAYGSAVAIPLKVVDPSDARFADAINSIAGLKGIDPDVIRTTLQVLSLVQEDKEKREQKREAVESESKKNKVFANKEYVFETRQDVFVYTDARTKGNWYYIYIKNEKTGRPPHKESLRTTNRIQALAKAQEIYTERRHKMNRGVKFTSITTKQLIDRYLKEREADIRSNPKEGLTQDSYNTLISNLKYWSDYIKFKKLSRAKIEEIPPEVGKDFAKWVEAQPKQTYKNSNYKQDRSRSTINAYVAATKYMYFNYAVEEKFIRPEEVPMFRYLKVSPDKNHKRDILTKEELDELFKWIQYSYCRESGVKELEILKRKVFSQFLSIHYATGMRNKEILGLKWSDISINPNESVELKKKNRVIFIAAEHSKNGKSRYVAAPVAANFSVIRGFYKRLEIKINPDDYVFLNLARTRRYNNIPYKEPAMENRLKNVIEGSGLKEKLDKENPPRKITLYSARHYYATDALMRKVNIYDLATNMGNTITHIEQTYSHVTAKMKSAELTAGQVVTKPLELQPEGIITMMIDHIIKENQITDEKEKDKVVADVNKIIRSNMKAIKNQFDDGLRGYMNDKDFDLSPMDKTRILASIKFPEKGAKEYLIGLFKEEIAEHRRKIRKIKEKY